MATQHKRRLLSRTFLPGGLGLALMLAAGSVIGQVNGASLPAAGKVVVAGTVPDEATRVAILNRVRELYGPERVVDQLSLGAVVAPPKIGRAHV